MYKYTATYTDYNGNEQTEDFYFNLSKAELLEMEMLHPEGFEGWVKRIIKADDRQTILETFKQIILQAYGEKDESGKRFVKNDALSESFKQTEAYSDLYVKLCSDAEFAAEFINGIVPKVEAVKTDQISSAK